MTERIPAIPTEYGGIQYKSRLEASWAQWLTEKGVRFYYEDGPNDVSPHLRADRTGGALLLGYRMPSGRGYLPDFWLPEIRTFLECKGDLTDPSVTKVTEFASYLGDEVKVVLGGSPAGHYFSVLSTAGRVWSPSTGRASLCGSCGRLWFWVEGESLVCRACGRYHQGPGDLAPFPTPAHLRGDGGYVAMPSKPDPAG